MAQRSLQLKATGGCALEELGDTRSACCGKAPLRLHFQSQARPSVLHSPAEHLANQSGYRPPPSLAKELCRLGITSARA